MSRSGYSEDCDDQWAAIRWAGQVASSTKGKRGQKLLIDLLQALDDMPVKKLITNKLKTDDGSFCTLGVLGDKRGLNMDEIHADCPDDVSKAFDIAEPLAREIVYYNDEYTEGMSPEDRWVYMRSWVEKRIKK